MSNLIKSTKKRLSNMERGQVLVLVAFAIVGIVAVVGLSLDVGVMFIENARLRRAVDAAALAAALQFRQGYEMSDLDRSAIEFLRLNGINDPNAIVQVCGGPEGHKIPDTLCPGSDQMAQKLVRVVARGTAYLAFLPVIGIDSAPIAAEATSETASVDVVLVLDRSESMTWTALPPTNDPPFSDPMRDPSVCNYAVNPDMSYQGYCRPFDEVKKAAVGFVDKLYFPYDRVAVVTFDKNPKVVLHFSNVKDDIISTIKGLTVYQGEETGIDQTGMNAIYPNGNPSRWYAPDTGTYWGLQCPQADPEIYPPYPDYPNPAPCTTTNIGAGLYTAGVEYNDNVEPGRKNSLWVVILLTDGVANGGYGENTVYFCPGGPGTGGPGEPANTWDNTDIPPRCNEGKTKSIPANRHSLEEPPTYYDAEDYAYDSADFVAHDQNALIITIGLGDKVIQPSTIDGTKLGENFLLYAANQGETPKPGQTVDLYFFAPDEAGLREVFRKISEKIATRLAH